MLAQHILRGVTPLFKGGAFTTCDVASCVCHGLAARAAICDFPAAAALFSEETPSLPATRWAFSLPRWVHGREYTGSAQPHITQLVFSPAEEAALDSCNAHVGEGDHVLYVFETTLEGGPRWDGRDVGEY